MEPVFAPNIVLIDITGRDEIKEDWDYDVKGYDDNGDKILVVTEQ